MKKRVLELRKDGKSAGGDYDDLILDRVPPGELWCIQTGAVKNATTAYTKLQIMIDRGESLEEEEEEPSPAANELYWLDRQYYLVEGERLRARLTGCTSGDLLSFTARGYREEDKPCLA